MYNNCLVCGVELRKANDLPSKTAAFECFSCENCGKYCLSYTAMTPISKIQDTDKKKKLSKLIFDRQKNNKWVIVNSDILKELKY